MPPQERLPARHRLTRADLPAELTPETLRHLGFGTLRELAHPANGILDAQEQQQFDTALAELRRGANSLVDESLERARRGRPGNLDPDMRRSYERMQQRLAEQAERARMRFPELALGPGSSTAEGPVPDAAPTAEKTIDDDVSPDTLEQQVEQTPRRSTCSIGSPHTNSNSSSTRSVSCSARPAACSSHYWCQ